MPRVHANVLQLHHRLQPPDVEKEPGSSAVLIPVDELFTPGFLRRHTLFSDFTALLTASAFSREQFAGLEGHTDDDWEKFIRRVSSFATWNAMLKDARGEWIMHRLGVCTDVFPWCGDAPKVP